MASLFDNIDLIKILGFGLSGLCLLLMILTYRLLAKVITQPNVSSAVISLIKWFMSITVLVLLVVGIFSLPIISRNNQLHNKNEKLIAKNDTLHSNYNMLVLLNNMKNQIDSLKTTVTVGQQITQLQKIEKLSTSFPSQVKFYNDTLQQKMRAFNVVINNKINTIKNNNKDTSLVLIAHPLYPNNPAVLADELNLQFSNEVIKHVKPRIDTSK